VLRQFAPNLPQLQNNLRRAAAAQQGRSSIGLGDALALVRAYQIDATYRDVAPLVDALAAEDDRRRYIAETDVRITTVDGATICTAQLRPRTAHRLPTLLRFTIYNDSAGIYREARRTASNGYVAATALTRGKGCSPDQPMPYVHDGADAAAVIDWIARQPWSDGRVGMFSGSYEGFTQWAAVKHMPAALKAIMAGAPVGPGIDVPMEGNVVWNFLYPWPFYTTNNKTLDNATYFDNARWSRLTREWYVSGRAYRDLEKIDGTPNPIFNEWLAHPTYDAFWQDMIPYRQEFAKIRIPVLQTAGYYFGGPGAAVYYFTEHLKYDPAARHYLVIGPWDHPQAQRGVVSALADTSTVLGGYEIDPVARIDIVADLRYQWFDHVLKGAPLPALLRDRVNYEVMSANVWKHAHSIPAMSNATLRLYLSPVHSGNAYRLARERSSADSSVIETVNLAQRADIDSVFPGGGVVDTAVNTWEAVEYVSDPLTEPTEVSGLFGGRLDFSTNKKDFDVYVGLFELTPKGEYIQLPPFWSRMSSIGDLTTRRLLTPGARQAVDFRSMRLVSRRLARGSRVVVILGPNKNPGQQINYGTGRDVNDETIADAGEPLTIRWFGGSYIDLPIRR